MKSRIRAYGCAGSVVFRRINHEAQTAEDLVACRFAVGLRIILCEFETDDIDAAVGDENIGFAVLVCSHCHGVVIDDVGDDFSVWQRLAVVQYLYGQIIADIELGGIFQGNDLVRQIRQGSHLVDAFKIIDAVFDGMRAYGRAGDLIHWLVDVFAVRPFRPIAVVEVDDRDGDIWRWVDGDVIAAVNDFERNPRIGFIEADKHRDILWVISIVFVTFAEDELGTVYLALLQRAAFTLFSLEDDERSFEVVQELMRHNLDDQGSVRSLYYRILIEKRDWSLILRETMQDGDRQLGWAYARLAACFMLTRKGSLHQAAAMFWEALSMAPNVPFYMLGYFPDPVDDSEEEEEDFHFSLLFADVWSSSLDLLNWFSRGVILFGLLSGRFGEEAEEILEILRSLGGGEEYDKMEALLDDQDDGSLIEALAAHRCLSKR